MNLLKWFVIIMWLLKMLQSAGEMQGDDSTGWQLADCTWANVLDDGNISVVEGDC